MICKNCGFNSVYYDNEEDNYKCLLCNRIQPIEIKEIKVPENNKNEIQDIIPPKPDVEGLNLKRKSMLLHKYYEDNKNIIINDLDTMGENPMKKKWGLGDSSWKVIRWRWLPDRYEKPSWYKKKENKPEIQESINKKIVKPEINKAKNILFIITDWDISILEDNEFNALWNSLGLLIKARHKANYPTIKK